MESMACSRAQNGTSPESSLLQSSQVHSKIFYSYSLSLSYAHRAPPHQQPPWGQSHQSGSPMSLK